MGWMRVNNRKLNPDQIEVLLVGLISFPGSGMSLVLDRIMFPYSPGTQLEGTASFQCCSWILK